jgi:hypothetical protein
MADCHASCFRHYAIRHYAAILPGISALRHYSQILLLIIIDITPLPADISLMQPYFEFLSLFHSHIIDAGIRLPLMAAIDTPFHGYFLHYAISFHYDEYTLLIFLH